MLCGMGMLTPHRRFVDPHNTDGIPTARRHRPLPKREHPLPGTKSLSTPKDGGLERILTRRPPENPRLARSAVVLGWMAMLSSIAFLVVLAFVNRFSDADWRFLDSDEMAMLVMLTLGFIHVFSIFSQITSSGRNLIGALALPVLYAGFFLLVILDHLWPAAGG